MNNFPINTISKTGFILKYFPITANYQGSKVGIFCGKNFARGAFCENCNKPLLRFFQLNSGNISEQISLGKIKSVGLFFCWSCTYSQNVFYYKTSHDGNMRILNEGLGKVIDNFPYDNYPMYFPEGFVELHEIPAKDQEIISKVNGGKVDEYDVDGKFQSILKPNHQIGGEPYLVEKEIRVLNCPICKAIMPFLACVADHCLDPRGFTGNTFVQVIYCICISCNVIGAYQCCD